MNRIAEFYTKHKEIIVIALLFSMALALRLWRLGMQSLWMDEAFSVWVASHSIPDIFEILKKDAHPPLFYLFLHFWLKKGVTEADLRFPFAIIGACNTVLVYLIGKKFFNSKTAFLASFFWAVSFICLNSETQVRMYSMATFFSLLATLSLQKVLQRETFMRWLSFIVFSFLSLSVHYYTGFIVLAQILFLVFLKRYKQALTCAILLGVISIPWANHFQAQWLNHTAYQLPSPQPHDLLTFSKFLGTYTLLSNSSLNVIISCIAFLVLVSTSFQIVKKRETFKYLSLFLFIIPFLVPWLISELTPRHIFIFRYAILYAPYFYLLFFYGVATSPRWVRLPAMVFLILVNFGLWNLFLSGQAYQRQNWRMAANTLNSKLQPGDFIIMEQPNCKYPLWYYLNFRKNFHKNNLTDELLSNSSNRIDYVTVTGDTPEPLFKDIISNRKREWLILCQAWLVDPHNKVFHWFVQKEETRDHYEFRSMEPSENIYLFLFVRSNRG